MHARRDDALLFAAVALIAGAALAYQLLLMRLLAISHWHPFAALIISLALLGHGASGTLLALRQAGGRTPPLSALPIAAALFAVAALGCHVVAQRLPFNGLELVWSPTQLLWLSALYLVLALPFFFAATAIALSFMHRPQRLPALYAADLLGAGLGALGLIALLFVVLPETALRFVAAGGLFAAACALSLPAARSRASVFAVVLAAAAALLMPASWLRPVMSEYKGLPRALQVMGALVVEERSSPYGLLTVIDSPRVPLRHAPGVSLTNTLEPPAQIGVFTDGEAMTAIARSVRPENLGYLDHVLSAAPYRMRERQRVLLLGAGGGAEVLQALRQGAAQVDAVEINPQMIELLRNAPGMADPRVHLHAADPRSFVRGTPEHYDLIVLGAADSLLAGGAGTQSAAEAYVYTVEALADDHARLASGGVLALTRWEKHPPRDMLKLIATARRMIDGRGADPRAHIVLLRNWDQALLLVGKDPFTSAELATLRTFAETEGFEIITAANAAERSVFHEGMTALLGDEARSFTERYKFHIEPATDERPYFNHFFQWRALPELLRLREQGGAVLLDSGYLLLIAALAQALPIGVLLVLLPRWALRRSIGVAFVRPGLYFLCLGLAFLFIEISFIQRLTLLVGQPLLAATTVLAGFLVGAGLGSASSPAWRRLWRRPSLAAAAGIAASAAAALGVLPALTDALVDQTVPVRALAAIACIAPLAFLMGMPFPLGLTRLAESDPALVPWAWGVNGCASVLSAILAALLAVHVGPSGLVIMAALLYVVGALAWREDGVRNLSSIHAVH